MQMNQKQHVPNNRHNWCYCTTTLNRVASINVHRCVSWLAMPTKTYTFIITNTSIVIYIHHHNINNVHELCVYDNLHKHHFRPCIDIVICIDRGSMLLVRMLAVSADVGCQAWCEMCGKNVSTQRPTAHSLPMSLTGLAQQLALHELLLCPIHRLAELLPQDIQCCRSNLCGVIEEPHCEHIVSRVGVAPPHSRRWLRILKLCSIIILISDMCHGQVWDANCAQPLTWLWLRRHKLCWPNLQQRDIKLICLCLWHCLCNFVRDMLGVQCWLRGVGLLHESNEVV